MDCFKGFKTLLIVMISFSTFAENKITELEFHPICKTLSDVSGTIMQNRQSGLTYEQNHTHILKHEDEDYFEALTLISEGAYRKRIATGTVGKKDQTTMFKVDVLLSCQNVAHEFMNKNSEVDRMYLRAALKTKFTKFVQTSY